MSHLHFTPQYIAPQYIAHKFMAPKYKIIMLLVAGGLASALTAHELPGRWVDLSHDLSAQSLFWPTAKRFELNVDAEGMTERGYYYSTLDLRATGQQQYCIWERTNAVTRE